MLSSNFNDVASSLIVLPINERCMYPIEKCRCRQLFCLSDNLRGTYSVVASLLCIILSSSCFAVFDADDPSRESLSLVSSAAIMSTFSPSAVSIL